MTNPMEEYLERYPPPGDPEPDRDAVYRGTERPQPRRIPVEREIDLHGLTVEEAREQLDRFIKGAVKSGLRKVLIIHGKGPKPGAESPLRGMVRRYLEQNPVIGTTGTPGVKEGGRGATWALIRQRSR